MTVQIVVVSDKELVPRKEIVSLTWVSEKGKYRAHIRVGPATSNFLTIYHIFMNIVLNCKPLRAP
jgi:hypothetical protein